MKKFGSEIQVEIDLAAERIVEASYAAAIDSVNRAFGRTEENTQRHIPKPRAASELQPRRSISELNALADRFVELVRASPGETMKARDLSSVVVKLKEANRIRTTGERNQTCYFPVAQRLIY